MVCSMFYSLIDRTDTTSFTGYIIDRYHWIPRTGGFVTRIIINASFHAPLWVIQNDFELSQCSFDPSTRTWYFCRIPNMYVTSLPFFPSIYSTISFIPASVTLINTPSCNRPLFLLSFSNWERYFQDIGGSV
jgi:hypothetical protein